MCLCSVNLDTRAKSLAPLVEIIMTHTTEKSFHCKALSWFKKTGGFYRKRLTTRSKKAKD